MGDDHKIESGFWMDYTPSASQVAATTLKVALKIAESKGWRWLQIYTSPRHAGRVLTKNDLL